MKESIGENNVNEKQLWHGTSSEIVEKIFVQNFDWRMVKTHAYGKGSYFARDSAYSDTYCKSGRDGICSMFLADVLVGYSTTVSD